MELTTVWRTDKDSDEEPAPVPESEPEPEPEPAFDNVPMVRWSAAHTAAWIARVLALPKNGKAVTAVRAEFEADELDGKELEAISAKHLQGVLRRAGIPNPRDATSALIRAREAIAPAASPAVPEAQTPLSTRWDAVITSPHAEDRRSSLQAALDKWRPQRWTIETQELGHGGSGAVFKAIDSRLGVVAIKFTHSEEPRKHEREAALMQRVAHAHVCRLYEHYIEQQSGLCGMIMELCTGGSLSEAIRGAPDGSGRLREFSVTRLAVHMLLALVHMHKQDVIHRDLKPSNIMLTEVDGELLYKLIDFSISAVNRDARPKVSDTLSTSTTGLAAVLGTPHYMSPEQFTAGEVVTAQTDLWSLAVVMFEALSGTLPFAQSETADDVKIMLAVRDVDLAAPRLEAVIEEVGAVSEPMCDFINKALQKDSSKRFGTAVEMQEALDAAMRYQGDDAFDLFISYRVWCDKEFAEALYRAASACQLHPGREHRMKVYLDKVRIVDGQRFDENFAKGLANSAVFTPLVSASCLKNFVELGQEDKEDFVLAEWIMAVELQSKGIIKAILPIVMGEQGKDGKYSQTFFEDLRDGRVSWPASDGFYAAGSGTISDAVSAKSTAKAKEFLSMLDPPVELGEELTVDAIVKKVLTFQAILLHFENDSIESADGMALVRVNSSHATRARAIARSHVTQTCAERIAKVVTACHAAPDPLDVEPEPEPVPDMSNVVHELQAKVNLPEEEAQQKHSRRDLRRFLEHIKDCEQNTDIAVGADVVAFIGDTGVGKSCTINFLLGHRMEERIIKLDSWGDEWGLLKVIDLAGGGDGILPEAKIGHKVVQCESRIKAYAHPSAELVLCDVPSLNGHGLNAAAIAVAFNKLARRAKSLRIVAVLDATTLAMSRGSKLQSALEAVMRMMKGLSQDLSQDMGSIMFLFTHGSKADVPRIGRLLSAYQQESEVTEQAFFSLIDHMLQLLRTYKDKLFVNLEWRAQEGVDMLRQMTAMPTPQDHIALPLEDFAREFRDECGHVENGIRAMISSRKPFKCFREDVELMHELQAKVNLPVVKESYTKVQEALRSYWGGDQAEPAPEPEGGGHGKLREQTSANILGILDILDTGVPLKRA